MKSRHLIEPQALEFIESLPPASLALERLAEIRASADTLWRASREKPPGVSVQRLQVPGVEGGPDVPALLYEPVEASVRGALLHIHGGGYVAGNARGESDWSEWLVAELGCVVIAPDYRLAPENPHPAPLEDCYAALAWLHANAPALHTDRRRIGVYGGSAGGGLAAAIALYARDRGEIGLCFQCLLYPMLDDRTAVQIDPNPFAGEYVWTSADNAFAWRCLLGHEPGRPDVSPYASAARASDLAGLPPTFIWVGALDLFVDESIEYAQRLIRAGVSTELHVYPGVTHGNILNADLPSSKQCRADILRALRRSLRDHTEV
jgi:triacylglycerol lipase